MYACRTGRSCVTSMTPRTTHHAGEDGADANDKEDVEDRRPDDRSNPHVALGDKHTWNCGER